MGSKGLFLVEEGTEIWKDDNLIKSYFLLVALVAASVPLKLWPITFLHDNKSARSNSFCSEKQVTFFSINVFMAIHF